MAKIHDIRSQTKRTNGTRPLSRVTHIARHHSATTSGDFFSFWKYWNGTNGWGTGGYHEIILRDGSVQLCYDPNEITNGVGNHNSYVYHICVVGNGSFTAAQEAAFKERCLYNMKRLNIPVHRVLGHNEFKGARTSCPGINMNNVRSGLTTQSEPVTVNPMDKGYLMYGDRGHDVKMLQTYLTKVGFEVEIMGFYNAATKQAVMDFQKARGLSVDGFYGPASKAEMNVALKEVDAKIKAEKQAQLEKEANKLPEQEYEKNASAGKSLIKGQEWVVESNISDGTYPERPVTRAELWETLRRYDQYRHGK